MMRNSKGVSLIALIVTIIVIIILAAIVMNASTSTVGNAQYARFAQEFGEFTDQVALDAANIKSNTGIRGQIINDAQMFYMTANGFSSVEMSGEQMNTKQGVAGYTMPVGYSLTNYENTTDGKDKGKYPYVLQYILNIGGAKKDGETIGVRASGEGEVAQVAYVIKDSAISSSASYTDETRNPAVQDGSAAREFYGDSNGKEYHFVTSNGQVFTLPGYPVQQSDGTIEYHIDSKNGHYYVVSGNSGLEIGAKNVNGSTVTNLKPILAAYLTHVHGIDAITGAYIPEDDNGEVDNGYLATLSRRTDKNNGTQP
jgi:type II secretory pathway pseudopilin PulG